MKEYFVSYKEHINDNVSLVKVCTGFDAARMFCTSVWRHSGAILAITVNGNVVYNRENTGNIGDWVYYPVQNTLHGEDIKVSPEFQTAIKHDLGKPLLGLLDSKWLIGVANVLTFGAKKYSPHNWRNGFKYSRLTDALLRHILAFNDGEDLDPETGLCHLYHASCCLMFLSNMYETRKDLDDRFNPAHATISNPGVNDGTSSAIHPES